MTNRSQPERRDARRPVPDRRGVRVPLTSAVGGWIAAVRGAEV